MLTRYSHEPVLPNEVLEYLQPSANQDFIDCTLGGGGHTFSILEHTAPNGRVIGIDRDPKAHEAATKRLQDKKMAHRLIGAQENFKKLKQIAYANNVSKVAGVLLDLGISSGQLQDELRGFSFLSTGVLDMRFGPDQDRTAAEILNTESQQELQRIFKDYGEEPLAKKIAEEIVEKRKEEPVQTADQLVALIAPIYKKYYRSSSKVNPATKVFQALRIAVNGELESLADALPEAVELLQPGGRIVVISYHSLEDRIVKNFFRRESTDCICPPDMPLCQCDHKASIKIITKKPITPTDEELVKNPRSRSAKLRVAERI